VTVVDVAPDTDGTHQPRLVGWRRWLNLAIGVLGIAVLVLGLAVVGRGEVTCRGEVMHPGDVCRKGTFTEANSEQTQTYEQRRASAQASRPTVIGLGLVLTAFSVTLMVVDRRRVDTDPDER